jgi:dTDP-glucose 4,6-dehydratase
LCERLVAEGNQVVCLDNFLTGKPANIAHLMGESGFTCLRCDLTEFLHVPDAVDLILHFASPASPVDYLRLPIQTLKVGAIGTWHALGLAKEKPPASSSPALLRCTGIRRYIRSPRTTGVT